MLILRYVHILVNICATKSVFLTFSVFINFNQTPILSVITSFKAGCQLSRCLICTNGHLSHSVVSQFCVQIVRSSKYVRSQLSGRYAARLNIRSNCQIIVSPSVFSPSICLLSFSWVQWVIHKFVLSIFYIFCVIFKVSLVYILCSVSSSHYSISIFYSPMLSILCKSV